MFELLGKGVCVKECPNNDTDTIVNCKPTKYMRFNEKYWDCEHHPNFTTSENRELGIMRKDFAFRYNT